MKRWTVYISRIDRIKDRHGLKVVDYLRPDDSDVDRDILALVRAAIAEATMGGGVVNNADLANDDDDDDAGEASDSE